MRHDIASAGLIGLLISAGIYVGASAVSVHLPRIVQGLGVRIVFAVLLLIALVEMPMMIFSLRRMTQGGSTPRVLVLATDVAYVAFASVYAAVFALITGETVGGWVIAAVSVARFASGMFIE